MCSTSSRMHCTCAGRRILPAFLARQWSSAANADEYLGRNYGCKGASSAQVSLVYMHGKRAEQLHSASNPKTSNARHEVPH
jgi:hypothetical protein